MILFALLTFEIYKILLFNFEPKIVEQKILPFYNLKYKIAKSFYNILCTSINFDLRKMK